MEKFSQRIWKGCKVITTDAMGKAGDLAILWQPLIVTLSDGRANKFSITYNFSLPGIEVKGTLVKIYRPSVFPQKHSFFIFLEWRTGQAFTSSWVIGGDFNLIALLSENKGGKRDSDRFQEAFSEILTRSSLLDAETRNGWYTWKNKRGGSHLVASKLDRFLITEGISHGRGEVNSSVMPSAGSDHWPIILH